MPSGDAYLFISQYFDNATIYSKFGCLPVTNMVLWDFNDPTAEKQCLSVEFISTWQLVERLAFSDTNPASDIAGVESATAEFRSSEEISDNVEKNRSDVDSIQEQHATIHIVLEPKLSAYSEIQTSERLGHDESYSRDIKTYTLQVLNYPTSIIVEIPKDMLSGKSATAYETLLNMALRSLREKRMITDDLKLESNRFELRDALNDGVDLSQANESYFSNVLKHVHLKWRQPQTIRSAAVENSTDGTEILEPYASKTISEHVVAFFDNLESAVKKEWHVLFYDPNDQPIDTRKTPDVNVTRTVCDVEGDVKFDDAASKVAKRHSGIIDRTLLNQSIDTNDVLTLNLLKNNAKTISSTIVSLIGKYLKTYACIKHSGPESRSCYGFVVPVLGNATNKSRDVASDLKQYKMAQKFQALEDVVGCESYFMDSKSFFWCITTRQKYKLDVRNGDRVTKRDMTLRQYAKNVIEFSVNADALASVVTKCRALEKALDFIYDNVVCAPLYALVKKAFNDACRSVLDRANKITAETDHQRYKKMSVASRRILQKLTKSAELDERIKAKMSKYKDDLKTLMNPIKQLRQLFKAENSSNRVQNTASRNHLDQFVKYRLCLILSDVVECAEPQFRKIAEAKNKEGKHVALLKWLDRIVTLKSPKITFSREEEPFFSKIVNVFLTLKNPECISIKTNAPYNASDKNKRPQSETSSPFDIGSTQTPPSSSKFSIVKRDDVVGTNLNYGSNSKTLIGGSSNCGRDVQRQQTSATSSPLNLTWNGDVTF
jgi:hypothetical protein